MSQSQSPTKLKFNVSEEADLTMPGETPGAVTEQPYKCVKGQVSVRRGKITIIKISNPYPGQLTFIKPTLESRDWDTQCRVWAVDGEYITLHLRNQVSDSTVKIHLYITTEYEDCQSPLA